MDGFTHMRSRISAMHAVPAGVSRYVSLCFQRVGDAGEQTRRPSPAAKTCQDPQVPTGRRVTALVPRHASRGAGRIGLIPIITMLSENYPQARVVGSNGTENRF